MHPNFRFTPQADRYDVAVLELDRQASYKDNIKPICLPQKDAIFVGRVAYVAGWGALQAGKFLLVELLEPNLLASVWPISVTFACSIVIIGPLGEGQHVV